MMVQHTAATPASDPTWVDSPNTPKLNLPRGACDTHVHVFGPRPRFTFAAGRSFTPSDAPKEKLFALHDFLGIERCVILHTATHGFDLSVTADALAAKGDAYKGVGLMPTTISDLELNRLAAAGFCGARFHYMICNISPVARRSTM